MSDELKPRNREEQYYEYMATGENAAELTPRHRQEQWFEKIAEGRISDYAELENTPIQPASESEVDGNYYYSEGSITRRIDGDDYELATIKDVDDAVTSVYKYKGSVATYSDLPSENLTIGDVYNVISDGNNYAWDGSDWDQLGGFKTNYPFPSSWQTSLTTDDFCADVNADGEAIEGMTYLGDVYFTDMPFSGNGDLVVEIIQGTGTSGKVIHLILTSGNVAPYRWEYTYWNNGSSTSGWLSWQLPIDSNNQLSASYIATDSDHLFVTDSEKSTWSGKQDLIDSAHQLAPEYINTDSTARFISDSELNAKQDVIDSTHQLNAAYINTDSSHLFVTDSEKSTWNNKQSSLTKRSGIYLSNSNIDIDQFSDSSTTFLFGHTPQDTNIHGNVYWSIERNGYNVQLYATIHVNSEISVTETPYFIVDKLLHSNREQYAFSTPTMWYDDDPYTLPTLTMDGETYVLYPVGPCYNMVSSNSAILNASGMAYAMNKDGVTYIIFYTKLLNTIPENSVFHISAHWTWDPSNAN